MIQYTQRQIETKILTAKSNIMIANQGIADVQFQDWEILLDPKDVPVPKLRLHYECQTPTKIESCTYDMYLS